MGNDATSNVLSSTSARKEVLADGVELWLGDCREVLPMLPKVDAVVTDPPYGLGDRWAGGKANTKAEWKLNDGGSEMGWDAEISNALPAAMQLAANASEALKQQDLFIEKPKPAKQEAML